MPRLPRPVILPLRTVWQPATVHTPSSVRSRLNSSISKGWTGADPEDHAVNRAKKRDTTDPATDASSAGLKDRAQAEGVADDSKSQGTTERGGSKHGRKAKEEHPNAPEPVIGMNDERGQKGN